MPDCARIQASVWFRSSVTKNIRSASERCAIEKIAIARLARRRPQERADLERLALEPGREARRREQVVEAHRERETLLRRVERLEVHDADLRDGGRLNPGDQGGEVEVLALLPRRCEDRRDEDVLAALQRIGVDAGEREKPCRRRGDPLAQGLFVASRFGAAARRTTSGSRPAARPSEPGV